MKSFYLGLIFIASAAVNTCNAQNAGVSSKAINFSGTLRAGCNPVYNTVSDTTCQGTPFVFNNKRYDTAGYYIDTLTTGSGCDSIVTLALTVNPTTPVYFTFDSLADAGYVDTLEGGLALWCSGVVYEFPLSGGSPPGGTYSGLGVNDGSINAYQALAHFGALNDGIDTITYSITDGNQCVASAYGLLEVAVCAGIQTVTSNNTFDLYPNPAADYTTISANEVAPGSIMKLLDITGKELLTIKLNSSTQQLPLSGLASGVYLVEVAAGGEIAIKLLVKTP